MIDHITALKLKDAGFPQYMKVSGKGFYGEYSPPYQDVLLPLYFPISDEIIEALVDNFYILEKRGDIFYCLKPNHFNDNENSWELSSGTSAALALANLFLYYNEVNEMEKTTVL
jgi:hypothetical protein